MAKIAYNACHGGFSLSEAALYRYAELKGLNLYPEKGAFSGLLTIYWTVPEEQRGAVLDGAAFYEASDDAKIASNKFYRENTLNSRDFERDDPALIQVIEELGEKANGPHAKLELADIAPGTAYRIDEYYGFESVETKDSYEWKIAG